MDVGSRVEVRPKEWHTLPEGHTGFGTVRDVQPAELLPSTMYFVAMDGLPEWQADWFFDELAPVSDLNPSSRIGDTDVCPPL